MDRRSCCAAARSAPASVGAARAGSASLMTTCCQAPAVSALRLWICGVYSHPQWMLAYADWSTPIWKAPENYQQLDTHLVLIQGGHFISPEQLGNYRIDTPPSCLFTMPYYICKPTRRSGTSAHIMQVWRAGLSMEAAQRQCTVSEPVSTLNLGPPMSEAAAEDCASSSSLL